MKRLLVPFLVVFPIAVAQANEYAAAEATAIEQGRTALGASTAAISEADLRSYVTRLASPEYEGRGTGDKGERMATAYLATFFEGLGLQPAGDPDSFYQPFEFSAGMELVGENSLTLKLDEPVGLVRRFTPGEHYQPSALSTAGKVEAGVVFAGFGIEANDYDSFAHLEVEGKWVMVLRGNPAERKELARFGPLAAKANIAMKKGAAGIIYVKGTNAAIPQELVPPDVPVGGRGQILPAITITDRLAAALLTGQADQERLQALFESYNKVEKTSGFPLPYTIAAEIGISANSDTGRNVVGRLVMGEAPSAEAILICAHIDHLGYGNRGGSRAKGEEAGKIHYGADDNASGVAVMMELAQFFADQKKDGLLKLPRDLIFAGWSGEEIGLRGSRHYVAQAKKKTGEENSLHPAIAACLNLDMVGRAKDGLQIMGTGSSQAWNSLLDALPEVAGLKIKRSPSPYLPTDSTSFYDAGVPVLAAFTGMHADYHTPHDTIDTVDFPGLGWVSGYMCSLTTALAERPQALDYVKVARGGPPKGPKVRLGVRPEDRAGGGVLIAEVVEGSPASRAGIVAGDILQALDGARVDHIESLFKILGTLKAGQEYEAVLRRGEEMVTLKLKPEER